jgi:hypothetical protein
MQGALKCQITVTAGIVLGEALPEYTKRWTMTNSEIDSPSGNALYNAVVRSATEYAACLMAPKQLNWVHCDWVWF